MTILSSLVIPAPELASEGVGVGKRPLFFLRGGWCVVCEGVCVVRREAGGPGTKGMRAPYYRYGYTLKPRRTICAKKLRRTAQN